MAGQPAVHRRGAIQIVLYRGALILCNVGIQPHGGIIDRHLIKLLVEDGEDGVVKAKAGDDQGGTAADADDGHPEPLLIAEQVAHSHLPGKGQMAPDGLDALQKYPPARFGGFGPHQVGGSGHQGGLAGPQGRPSGTQHRRRHRHDAQHRLALEVQARDIVHNAEGIGNDLGDQSISQNQADNAAQQAGRKGVAQIFHGNGQPGEAHSLQRADLGALVLHHAGHGGQAGQSRHQEENDGEDVGQIAHPLGVLGVADKAAVGVTAQHIPFALL